MKPSRRQGIVIAIVRDRGNAEVRRAVVEVVEVVVVEGSCK